jgi:hypothetical protein
MIPHMVSSPSHPSRRRDGAILTPVEPAAYPRTADDGQYEHAIKEQDQTSAALSLLYRRQDVTTSCLAVERI